MASKIKLIAVSKENYENLRKFGEFGDSFDNVITKILNKIDAIPKSDTN
jgi:predicted CopG family antitoxin